MGQIIGNSVFCFHFFSREVEYCNLVINLCNSNTSFPVYKIACQNYLIYIAKNALSFQHLFKTCCQFPFEKKALIFLHLVHEKAVIVAQWCPLKYHWSPFVMFKWSSFAIPCPISSSACCLLPIWLQAFRDPVLIDFCKICSQILIIVFIYVYIYIYI